MKSAAEVQLGHDASGTGRVHADWSRLEELVRRLSRGRRHDPGDLREFWRLYRGATSRLAAVQAEGRADDEEWYLNRLVGAAHAVLYRSGESRSLVRRAFAFFSRGWPAAVRSARGAVGLATGLFGAGALLGAFYAAADPGFPGLVVPPDMIASIERGEMWTGSILAVQPAASSAIFSNNLSVSIFAFALGMTAGLGTAWLLVMNGILIGALAWLVGQHGMAGEFWGFVSPHGVLELPAVFIAGAAGLTIARGLLLPGDRPWRASVAAASREGLRLLLGCGPVLLVAAAVEAWFSPVPFPGWMKAAGAAVLAAAFLAYLARREAPRDVPPGAAPGTAEPRSVSAAARTVR